MPPIQFSVEFFRVKPFSCLPSEKMNPLSLTFFISTFWLVFDQETRWVFPRNNFSVTTKVKVTKSSLTLFVAPTYLLTTFGFSCKWLLGKRRCLPTCHHYAYHGFCTATIEMENERTHDKQAAKKAQKNFIMHLLNVTIKFQHHTCKPSAMWKRGKENFSST